MKQVRLPQTVEYRLSSYARQAKRYSNTPTHKNLNLRKGSLMALVPLAAASLLPAASKACSFSMTFPAPATGSSALMYIDLGLTQCNVGVDDFIIRYYRGTGSFRSLGASALNGNSIQNIGVLGGGIYVPRLYYSQTVTTPNFQASVSGLIYAGTPGSHIGYPMPPPPLGTTEYIGINACGFYGFLAITISGGTVTITGGINPDTSPGNPFPVRAGVCSTLPVELSNFQAKTVDDDILLEWETATEINNLGFEVQRSMNGKDFQKMAWLDGHGTTAEAQSYRFKDEKVQANQLYYYRLRQIDTDGAVEYSSTISAEVKGIRTHHIGAVSPNPVQQIATLNLDLIKAEEVEVALFNSQGKEVQRFQQILEEGKQTLPIDMSNLSSGSYFAKASVGSQMTYRKIMKID